MKIDIKLLIIIFLLILLICPVLAEVNYTRLFLNVNYLILDASLDSFFDNTNKKRLDNGLSNLILMRIMVQKEGKSQPVEMFARECIIRYELWELKYLVSIDDHGSQKKLIKTKREDALKSCVNLKNYRLIDMSKMQKGNYYVRIITELNPVSDELIANVRRWIRRSPESHRQYGTGENFFGSMVSIFVNQHIGRADKRIVIRTENFRWEKQ